MVTSCAHEIWYEDIDVAAGTMVELAAANGDIDVRGVSKGIYS